MRKGWFLLLSLVLVAALVVPASAEVKLTGFYRVKPTVSNIVGAGNSQYVTPTSLTDSNTGTTRSFTEMRNRLRFEVGDENVKGVTFFELDGNFGDEGGKIGRNQGFASNGDSINLETKQAYVWFKVPNTALDFTVGLQGYSDVFNGLIFGGSDQAGVVANYKLDPVALRLTWLALRDDVNFVDGTEATVTITDVNKYKTWSANNIGSKSADYFAIDAMFKPTKETNLTAHFGFLNDIEMTNADYGTKLYYLGAAGAIQLAPVKLSAFVLYNFGKAEYEGGGNLDVDINGLAAMVRADANLGPGKFFIEGLWIQGDDDPDDDEVKGIITGNRYGVLTSYYSSPDLYLLLPNADMINSATAVSLDPTNGGRGCLMLAAGYSQKLTEKLSGKIGVGYLTVREDDGADGNVMGTEVNGNVNYNIAKGLDFGIYAAYVSLGNFFNQTASADDPNNLYLVNGRLNFAF